ncbi:MAG: zinc ribbon domain-containing protein [Enterococcus sp.]
MVQVDRYFPSTQLCSVCHELTGPKKDTTIRKWSCPTCGTHHDRDVNAAENLYQEGLRFLKEITAGTTGLA